MKKILYPLPDLVTPQWVKNELSILVQRSTTSTEGYWVGNGKRKPFTPLISSLQMYLRDGNVNHLVREYATLCAQAAMDMYMYGIIAPQYKSPEQGWEKHYVYEDDPKPLHAVIARRISWWFGAWAGTYGA